MCIRDRAEVGFDLGEDCRWLADYLATKHENTFAGEENDHYWYVAMTSGGWWVRRSIDGTEEQFFEILTQLHIHLTSAGIHT